MVSTLGRGWPRSSDVGQSLRSADQGVADHGRRLDGRTNAFHFQANVEIKAMNHADQWASPLFSQPLGKMSDRPQGMADHDVRPPLTKLLFHPFPTSADAGDRQSWIRVVRGEQKIGAPRWGPRHAPTVVGPLKRPSSLNVVPRRNAASLVAGSPPSPRGRVP